MQPDPMTLEQFFAWQLNQDLNYELVEGAPVLPERSRVGATDRHDRVRVNAIVNLFAQLRNGPCRVSTSNKSVITGRATTRRPDLLVECGTPGDRSLASDKPRVVVEVLSPSTVRVDRFRKLTEYQQTPAIDVILLVETEAPRVVVYRRSADAWAVEEHAGTEAIIPLPEIAARLPLADLYDGLTFEA